MFETGAQVPHMTQHGDADWCQAEAAVGAHIRNSIFDEHRAIEACIFTRQELAKVIHSWSMQPPSLNTDVCPKTLVEATSLCACLPSSSSQNGEQQVKNQVVSCLVLGNIIVTDPEFSCCMRTSRREH